jgi:ribosomal protein S20
MVKAKVKNLVKASIKKVQSGDQTDLDGATRKAIQAIDKAAKKAVIKKNTASRMKSALMKRINAGPKK